MNDIIKYSDYELNESKITVEIDDTQEGAYLLTVDDISNIVHSFVDTTISKEAIIEELQNYKFIKIDDPEIKKVEEPIEEIDELSSDDENPTFIKKFEME